MTDQRVLLIGGYNARKDKWENLRHHLEEWQKYTALPNGRAIMKDVLRTMDGLEELEEKEE